MYKKSIVVVFALLMVVFFAAENSNAQSGPCLLGVGNCSPGTPNTGNQNVAPKVGRFLLSPALSTDAMQHLNYGSRYLLKVSTPYLDPNGSGCMVESRAWVAAVEGNNGTQITVKVGTPQAVLLCNNALSVEQINQAEVNIENARRWIVELSNNPTKYANAQGWINQYTDYINKSRAVISQNAPN